MAEDVHQQMREPVIHGSQQAWKQTNTVFTNAKAGMDGVDKDRVKKVIYEMSKVNSSCFGLRGQLRSSPISLLNEKEATEENRSIEWHVLRKDCHRTPLISGMSNGSSSRQMHEFLVF